MCVGTMATKPKSIKNHCLRRTMKLGSKLKWRLLRMDDAEAYKPWRASAVKATIPKYILREQRRAQLAKLSGKYLSNDGPSESRYEADERSAVEFTHSHPPGAMAPENTTQYLMNNVYGDLLNHPGSDTEHIPAPSRASAHVYDEALSPERVYFALDSAYESCLHFQQRDFEEVYALSCA